MKKIFSIAAAALICIAASAQETVKVGIIGLDTSHSTAFTKIINGGANDWANGFKVVAAYPQGSSIIKTSYEKIPEYTAKVKEYGVEIVGSIAELLDKVDCVLLETNDGTIHFEQALEVFKSGKTCFIDKPLGATLGQAIAIYKMAEKYNIPVFSSSALRFSNNNTMLGAGEYGQVIGADCYSPHTVEPTHPDYGFYGIHGIESLFTIMGTGCDRVNCMATEYGDVVTGVWSDGRLATFRAVVKGPYGFGGTAITATNGFIPVSDYEGYECLLKEVLKFFQTGVSPIENDETIEIFTFMRAANLSKKNGGKVVTMEEAYKSGLKEAEKLIKKYDK